MKPSLHFSTPWISAAFVTRLAAVAVSLIACLTLAGHAFDISALDRINPRWVPMRLITAICFLLCAGALMALESGPGARLKLALARASAVLVSVAGALNLATYLSEILTGLPWSLGAYEFLNPFLSIENRMALNTAVLFILFGFVLLLLSSRSRRAAGVSHGLLLPMTLVTHLALVGYIFTIPGLYDWMGLGMALNTALAFYGLCLACFFARPDTWLMDVFTSKGAGGAMARRLLPFLLVLPILIGWFRITGERVGYFGSEIGIALVVVAYTISFLGVVWLNARSVNRTDKDRLRAEGTLRESEERLRTVLDALPVGVFLSDESGNVVFTNPAVASIWGISTLVKRDEYGEYKGRFRETGQPVAPDDWALAHALKTGQPYTNDPVEIDRPNGAIKIIHNFALPIHDAAGRVAGAVVVTEDVTDRTIAQEQIRKAKDDAEQSARELARSNEDLEQFAYVASHDLQEPLRAVAGFMSILKTAYHDKLDATGQEYIGHAIEGAERMRSLINDLLTYSRVGTKGGAFVRMSMSEAFSAAVDNVRASLAEAQAVVSSDEDLPAVTADMTQMTQLLQNLISNAIKFRGDKAPEIHVSAKREDARWVFGVRDNGIGIEPQYYERIFLIFQRLHGRRKYSGTGIGLAVCKKIVERHGGIMWVESKPNEGSTFYFTIPDRGIFS